MKNVGKSPRRDDIPAKVNGTQRWAVMKVPGMLHARNVRPPMVGATLKAIDESSVKNVPGVVKVVSRGNYVDRMRTRAGDPGGAPVEVEWTPPQAAPFPASENLFTYMRSATPSSTGKPVVVEPSLACRPDEARSALRRAFPGTHRIRSRARDGRSVERAAHHLFERHEVSGDAQRRRAVPEDPARDRARGVDAGPCRYGRTAADDAGFEAAFLAEVGRPVRVQWSRQEETAWDTKGPPTQSRCVAPSMQTDS